MKQKELAGRCEAYQVEKIRQIQAWSEEDHEGCLVLFGDSLLNRFDVQGLHCEKPILNCGIDGATSQTLYLVLDEVIQLKPAQILFLVGTNDLDDAHEFDCLDITFALFNMVSSIYQQLPNTKVTLLTPLPIDECRQRTRSRNNRTLKMLGNEIKALKDDLPIEVIDMYTPFLDDSNSLNHELTCDGLHLNDKGYALFADLLKGRVF